MLSFASRALGQGEASRGDERLFDFVDDAGGGSFHTSTSTRFTPYFDVASALEHAKGEVALKVTKMARNPQGLDESLLDLSVRELISQHGLDVEWDEE